MRENLKKALSNLRNLDGVTLIEEGQNLVALDPAHCWVDVAEFVQLANDATIDDVDTLQRAAHLHQSNFLTGFNTSLSYEFEAWALSEQTRLKGQMVEVLRRLADEYAQRNALPQAIAAVRRLLQLEPWREEAHRRLMEFLVQNDQREAALVQYTTCRQLLAEELAVEPGPETVALYAQICAGKMRQGAEKPAHTAALLPLRHNLPAQTTALLGRQVELAQLTRLLTEPTTRLVNIVAPGGMGKTHLALEAASTLLDRYQHGVYFVALAPLSETDTMVSAIAAGVDYTFQMDGRLPKQQLLDHLREKELLLLLDNAEHLLAGVTLFTDILQAAPKLRLLITSRERLQLNSETIFVLAGLAISDPMHGERAAAVQLFLQTAQRVRPSFTPSVADWPAIVQLCRLVGGMPLGLILAATWIEMLTPVEIASEINQSLDFLAADLHDLPERHRSLRAIFDTTWQRLGATERGAFQKLAIFRGGFTRKAAATVAGASLSILSTLSHKSLIQLQPNRRYEMHELLRQFALDTLAEQLVELRDTHGTYFCTFLAQREGDLKGARQQAAMAEIEADGENVRTAWQWAVERTQIEQLTQALESLGLFYLWKSRLYEGEAMCRLVVERLALTLPGGKLPNDNCDLQTTSCQSDLVRFGLRALIWLSIFQHHLNQAEFAQHALHQAQAWLVHPSLTGLDTRSEQAQLQLQEAEVIFHYEEASALAEQSLSILRTLDDPWHLAQALDLLGVTFRIKGLLERARQAAEEGLTLRQALGDARGMAGSLKNLSNLARWLGRFEEAGDLIRQSIAIFAELNDRGQQAIAIHTLAGILVHGGQFAESLQLFEESLSIHHALGLPGEPGAPTLVKGFALMHLGRYEEALAHLERSLSLYAKAETGFPVKNLGRLALAKGIYHAAQQHLHEALALFRDNGDMNGLGQTLGCLGYVALRQHNLQQAQAYICENLQLAAETRLFLPSMTALAGVALLRGEQGEYAAAIELYTVALQNGHVANSRWYQDVVGQHIDAIAQTLPAEIVEAAQARGRGREWRSTVQELLTAWEGTSQRANTSFI